MPTLEEKWREDKMANENEVNILFFCLDFGFVIFSSKKLFGQLPLAGIKMTLKVHKRYSLFLFFFTIDTIKLARNMTVWMVLEYKCYHHTIICLFSRASLFIKTYSEAIDAYANM